ncbi:UvrB/UvrC motif-containing protein [bacterium]|nr:UvrB/UvrC motif-containing protein [bacterium]
MLCDICEKRAATVHLTQILNNSMTKLHLCEECAGKKGIEFPSLDQMSPAKPYFDLNSLLKGLNDFEIPYTIEEPALSKKCPNCNTTYNDFKELGRLGCCECYSTFNRKLMPLLKKLHNSVKHGGKSPVTVTREGGRREILKLRQDLEEAIEKEEYEKAAKIRDKIKKLGKS